MSTPCWSARRFRLRRNAELRGQPDLARDLLVDSCSVRAECGGELTGPNTTDPPQCGALSAGPSERRLGLARKLAVQIADPRDPARVIYPLPGILRVRILAIACGYEDADDLDHLRSDPGLKLACGRLPDTRRNLPLQPTISR